MNFLVRSWVSSWIAPSGLPSDVASGTHITERILNSAMLAAGPSDGVAGRVLAQVRLHRLDRLLDDRPAEPRVVLPGAAALDDLRDRAVPASSSMHHEAPVGLAEHAEQGVGDLRQERVELERPRQVLC